MITDEAGPACRRKPLIYSAISFLVMLSASANLEAHLYLPNIVWIGSGVLIAGGWAYEKFCRFEEIDSDLNDSEECSACGLFGHKIPWILLVSCGLINFIDLSEEWSAYTSYAIVLALFSLAGSFFMMRFSGDHPAGNHTP
ncbi:MAG: hypothetical protein HOL66_07000 [Rhodospirillaceae bacterium]|jgi:hypothetical protein|nr:hypothetical protein [Rhodospirillaceae bacterium]